MLQVGFSIGVPCKIVAKNVFDLCAPHYALKNMTSRAGSPVNISVRDLSVLYGSVLGSRCYCKEGTSSY